MKNLLPVLALLTICITASGCGLLHTHSKEPQEIKVVIEQEPIVIQQVPAATPDSEATETPDNKNDDGTASTEDNDVAEEESDLSVGQAGEIRGLGSIKVTKSRLEKLRELRGDQ